MKWTVFNDAINYIKHSLLKLQAIFDGNWRAAFNGRIKKAVGLLLLPTWCRLVLLTVVVEMHRDGTVADVPTDGIHTTEWEREREREEFAQAARLYRPVSAMIASRFTRAKYDDDDKAELPADDSVRCALCRISSLFFLQCSDTVRLVIGKALGL